MKRLIAVNENMAVYSRDSSRPDVRFDPCDYLCSLLKIRSARSLVRFLRDYPHELSAPVDEVLLRYCDENSTGPEGALRFKAASIMKEADRIGADYFDAMTDLGANANDEASPGDVAERFCFVEIRKLEDLAERVRALLSMASTCYGSGACEGMFDHEERGEVKMVSIGLEDAMGIFPEGLNPMEFKYQSVKPWFERVGSTGFSMVADSGIHFRTNAPREEAVMEAAGILTSMALTDWMERFGEGARVQYTANKGFVLQNAEVREIPLELARIVIEKDLGICPVCGKSFIAKRAGEGGEPTRKYCSDSCKDKASSKRS